VQRHLYFTDTYLTEQATTVARVGRGEDGGPWIALADNIFHPQGGGQPSDLGTVDGHAGRGRKGEDEGWVVVDLLAPDGSDTAEQPFTVGDAVTARIDAVARRLHAALHTAGHLIDAYVRRLGLPHAGNSHFPGQARVDYLVEDRAIDRAELTEQLGKHLAESLGAALPVTAGYRDGVRHVTIEGLNSEPCGGTHVRDLSLLTDVSIRSIKVKSGRLRVGYDAAHV
jgi:Ser-tRNA(Ala) deacylase AlaX